MKKTLRIGHKGACGYEPENTLASFEKAIRLGSDMVELDVRLTKDRVPVIIHDADVKRITGMKGNVSKMTFSEIDKLRTGNNKIPSLEEAVELCSGQCLMDIELKVDAVKEVVDVIGRYDMCRDVIVTSFHHKLLKEVHKINPEIKTGALFNQSAYSHLKWNYRLYTNMLIKKALSIKAEIILPHYTMVKEHLIKEAHSNRIAVYAWTVNEPEEIARLKRIGVDGIISDYPDRI